MNTVKFCATVSTQQLAHQRIQTQSLHTLDFMQVRVRGLGSLTRRATPRGGAAPPRCGAGDGDGPLADGRTPVECRALPGYLFSY